jgi:hypothetical protein
MGDETPFTQRDAANLERAMRDLTTEMREFRKEIAQTYVRKDALEPVLLGLRKDVDTHSKWFTWIIQTVGAVIIVGLIGLLISGGIHYGGS